jgi:hypothetical protein
MAFAYEEQPSQELHYPPAWDEPGPSNRTPRPVTPTREPLYNFNTPSQQSHIVPYLSSPSLARNLEPVTRFLVEKAGQPLNEFEAAGIVDYIQKNVQGMMFFPLTQHAVYACTHA